MSGKLIHQNAASPVLVRVFSSQTGKQAFKSLKTKPCCCSVVELCTSSTSRQHIWWHITAHYGTFTGTFAHASTRWHMESVGKRGVLIERLGHSCHTRHMKTNVPISGETLAAIQTLVRAGVSDVAIGRAMRDLLLAADGDRLSPLSGTSWTEQRPPGNISATAEPTLHTEASPGHAGAASSPSLAGMVPLKVRFATGKASNVSIPAKLLHLVGVKLGSDETARQRIRDMAKEIPEDASNRSGIIQAALNALLAD